MTGIVVLPGLDGWAEARRELAHALTPLGRSVLVDYPPDRLHGRQELEDLVRDALAEADHPALLVAESYSGPVAIRIAADPPPSLAGVVLASTFAAPPAPRWLRHLATAGIVSRPPPDVFIRRLLVGTDAPPGLVDLARRAIARVEPRVLSGRLRQALAVDVRPELERTTLPILHLAPTDDRLVGRRSQIRGTTVRTVRPEGPHAILQRHPDLVARHVIDFARQIDGDA